MDKMNFSRGIYFQSLCNYIFQLPKKELNSNVAKIIDEIDFQIEYIYRKQNGGFWEVTCGDKVFITYMSQLKQALSQGKIEIVSQLVDRVVEYAESKLKIVFLAQESFAWPSFESFYDACDKDDRYIPQLVYVPFEHINTDTSRDDFKIYKEDMGLPIMRHDEYSLSRESPDVVVFMKPYDCIPKQYYIDDVDRVVRRCVYISYGLEVAQWSANYHFRMPLQFKAWKFIGYGNLVKKFAKEYGYNNGVNVAVWGHPRSDSYIDPGKKRENIPNAWKEKINNRKVALWNTQHTILNNIGDGTYFRWKDEVFRYFEANKDIVLLWRPHPFMFSSIIKNGFMSETELDVFLQYLENLDNVIIDRTVDYRNSFFVSDAIVSDGTTFLIEYLYTGKPILFTPKGKNGIYDKEEICKGLYVAEKENDIVQFLNMIKSNVDIMKKERENLVTNLLVINEGGNGQFIKDAIYTNIIEESKYEICET